MNRRIAPGFKFGGASAVIVGIFILVALISAVSCWQKQSIAGALTTLQQTPVDLINGRHWQMAGTKLINNGTNDRLEITNTNLAIVNQDGTPGFDNSPVNLYGVRLSKNGDFSVVYKLSNVSDEAVLSLYGAPPFIEDEIRAEQGTLDMRIDGNIFNVDLSDQKSGELIEKKSAVITQSLNHTVVVINQNGQLKFRLDGKLLGIKLSDHNIFNTQKVWLGFNARTNGSHFTVNKFTAKGINGGTVQAYDTRNLSPISQKIDGLSALAVKNRAGFLFGTAVAPGPMVSVGKYRQLLGNFNSYTTENVGKWQFIHPRPSLYNFNDLDAVVAMANKNHATVHLHTLIFGEANPRWLQGLAKTNPSAMESTGLRHIETLGARYKNKFKTIDVINEPLVDEGRPGKYGLRKNIWYKTVGPEYLVVFLKAARKSFPGSALCINEFGMESNDSRFNTMVKLIKHIKVFGGPIDCVGFQSHIDEGDTNNSDTHIDVNKLRNRFRILATLGVSSRISEADITNSSEHAVLSDLTKACLTSSSCKGVTTWGITDRYSSSADIDQNGILSYGEGLLWDKNYFPTLAENDLTNYLQ